MLTAYPEGTHQERIISGVLAQCRRYGYNVTVLSTTINLHTPRQRFLLGEINIYSLLNPDIVDGIILDTAPLTGDNSGNIFREIAESALMRSYKKPIVSIEMPWDHYHVISNENEEILRESVRHAVNVHGKKKLCILTGYESEPISHSRLNVFVDEARKLGIKIPNEYIIFGDFWYTSGQALAKRFLSGELALPEAVLCASDHMALGLLSALTAGGIRVPDDLIILGFEACPEALCNDIPLSTFEANDIRTAANAVNYLRSVLEPDEPVFEPDLPAKQLFHAGMTCGCSSDYLSCARAFKNALCLPQNYCTTNERNINIGLLMESYLLEDLTTARTPDECLFTVLANTYLITPFENVYLCLTPNWLEMHDDITSGYPEQMKVVMRCSKNPELSFASENGYLFETKTLLPHLDDPSDEPHVFYFSPMHFNEHTLGYAVLERTLSDPIRLNLVYKNWLRFVNNALEMSRTKYKLMHISIRDEMTGAFNRRGLYLKLDDMLRNKTPGSQFFCAVIDMDGLKAINDTYGHNEGDFGIRTVAAAASAITRHHEICVRAGGDEFYIIGVGQYDEDAAQKRTEQFLELMQQKTDTLHKPYQITASIGCITCPIGERFNADESIHKADEIMYAFKVQRKLHRIQ
ncbi:MAG: GGDEF domain-containing protein [Oscillospiraceae bacterium]|nr:GGDEF domain-containing protein [Oscillospiraceae bacterium]